MADTVLDFPGVTVPNETAPATPSSVGEPSQQKNTAGSKEAATQPEVRVERK